MSDVLDVLGLPPPDSNNIINSCIFYRLDTSQVDIGQKLSLEVSVTSSGNIPEHYIQNDCRVQIIVPVLDPEFGNDSINEWYPLFHNPKLSIERKTWNEGVKAQIVISKDGEANDLPLHIMLVIDNDRIDFEQFKLKIRARKISSPSFRSEIATQYVKFESNCKDYYEGSDEVLMDIFRENDGFKLTEKGSIFHPKQIHSFHSIKSYLLDFIDRSEPVTITYVGPDTCENLHSVLRLVNDLVKRGLKVDCFYFIHKQWDERSMDKIRILNPTYFTDSGLNFRVKPMPVESGDGVSSDLIITTYVTSWAYSSKVRGNATEQYLNDIIKRIKDEKSLVISVDPVDVNRVARSFNSMVYHGKPSDVFQLSGLKMQDFAPGGYGDYMLDQEREVCWVTAYKKASSIHKLRMEKPLPNDFAKLSRLVYPAGREAIIDRLIKPKLKSSNCGEYLRRSIDSDSELWPGKNILDLDNFSSNKENFCLIVGGPGDGKSVLLQQLLVSKRDNEDEVSVSLSARSLTQDAYLNTLSMREGDEKISHFIDLIEKECLKSHHKLTWNGNIKRWISKGFRLNLYVDALDEVRNINDRNEIFSILNLVSKSLFSVSVKISMRENILRQTLVNFKNKNHDFDLNNLRVYKIEWDESRIINNFIPSLLHGWNLKFDSHSFEELNWFLTSSKKSLRNKSAEESRIFLKNPLRAVWLVNFVYDQSVDLKNMRVSTFEDEILRLSVKNRYEIRRLDGLEVPEPILEELLDILASIAVLDYNWDSGCVDFNEDNREKFIEFVKSSSVSNFISSRRNIDLKQFFFEDMSLLYVTNRDNLAWIHENLREHAIARGLIGYEDGSLCKELIDNWEIEIPNLKDIFLNYQDYCSLELSDAIRRKISTESLLDYSCSWLNSWNLSSSETSTEYEEMGAVSDDLSDINRVLEVVVNLEDELKKSVDNQNSLSAELRNERNQLNKKVKRLKLERHDCKSRRDEMNRLVKTLKQDRRLLEAEIESLSKIYLKSKMSEDNNRLAKLEEKRSKLRGQINENAKQSQDLHERMLVLHEQITDLHESASIKHNNLKASKKIGDKLYNSYVLLKYRIKREINHRKFATSQNNKENLLSRYESESVVENKIKKTISEYYKNQKIEYRKTFTNEIFDSISVDWLTNGIDVILNSVNNNALIGKSGNRVKELASNLEMEYDMQVGIRCRPTEISQDYLADLLDDEIDKLLLEETGDYRLDVFGYEFEPFNQSNEHEEVPNRCLILVSSNPRELSKSGFIQKLQDEIISRIGRPFFVKTKGVDLDSVAVKDELLDYLGRISDNSIGADIYVMPLENTKGRRVVMQVESVDLVKDYINNLKEEMIKKFGYPFEIKLELDQHEVMHLNLEEVKASTLKIIRDLYPPSSEEYTLSDIEIFELNGIENRKIIVYGRPFLALVGKRGDILHSIKGSLTEIYGPPINFHSLPPVPDKTELQNKIVELIYELDNPPEDFKLLSIEIRDNYNSKSKLMEENRKIILDSTDNRFILGKHSINRINLLKHLNSEYDGKFRIEFRRKKVKNLDSEIVKEHLLGIINQHLEEWEIEDEFEIHDISTQPVDNASGRNIQIHCTRPRALIGSKGVNVKKLVGLMEEKFGRPIIISFRGDHESIPKEKMTKFAYQLFNSYYGESNYNILFDNLDGAENRWLKISSEQTLSNETKDDVRSIIESEFGKPVKVTYIGS